MKMHIFLFTKDANHTKEENTCNFSPSTNDKISTIASFAVILEQWGDSRFSNIPMIYF